MEETELHNLWKGYNSKLEVSLTFNRKNAEDLTKIKIRSLLGSMRPVKMFTILVGIFWVGFLDTLLFHLFAVATPFFLVSAAIQVIVTKIAIGIYLYQLILIHQTDITEPIFATQDKLAKLKTTTLLAVRILFLQLPVWSTFYWNRNMLESGNIPLFILQLTTTILLTCLAIWLFVNIRYENREKQWFRMLLHGAEWEPILKSFDLLTQTAEYKK